jgi:TM2 domain-containing membrane protein YozV
MTDGQGSAGNVLAALASLLIPGLGQLLQGRWLSAILFLLLSAILWFFFLGWIAHLWACIDAARWRP